MGKWVVDIRQGEGMRLVNVEILERVEVLRVNPATWVVEGMGREGSYTLGQAKSEAAALYLMRDLLDPKSTTGVLTPSYLEDWHLHAVYGGG